MCISFMCWKTCLLAENTTNSPFFHNAPRFLLGRLYYAGEIGNNGYAKFLEGKQGALWSM